MIVRTAIVVCLLLGAGVYSARLGSTEVSVAREPLRALPLDVGGWHGRDATPLADDVLGTLGVDDYVNRFYVPETAPASSANAAASTPVGLYVGYYASQRQGDTIHSPQNCLPGAGWRPVEAGRASIDAGGRTLEVNRYVIQKGLDRQVVLYWYQGRGRVVANEYTNKALLMLDAARLNRTSGGLVRVMAPVQTTAEATTEGLTRFVAALFPHLERHLP
jgi:EpsI family protein